MDKRTEISAILNYLDFCDQHFYVEMSLKCTSKYTMRQMTDIVALLIL